VQVRITPISGKSHMFRADHDRQNSARPVNSKVTERQTLSKHDNPRPAHPLSKSASGPK